MKYGEFIEIQNIAIEILKKMEVEYRQSKTVDSFMVNNITMMYFNISHIITYGIFLETNDNIIQTN